MSQAYLGIPIAITVEGANALTRSLISFGQVRLPRVESPGARRRWGAENSCSQRSAGRLGVDSVLCGVCAQGLNRSHPHLLDLIETIRAGNDLEGFNRCARTRPATVTSLPSRPLN